MSRANAAGSSITDTISVKPVVNLHGGQPPVWKFPEMTAETFKAGEMLCLSGAAATRTGITTPPVDASGYGIIGFAAEDAAGAISSFRAVYIATPATIFCGNIWHSTSASAQTAASDVGKCYGLTTVSAAATIGGTKTFIDKAKTAMSTVLVRVVGLHEQDAVPSFYGKAYFTVLQPACQFYNAYTWNTSGNPGLLV
jgi:hypothetical protein